MRRTRTTAGRLVTAATVVAVVGTGCGVAEPNVDAALMDVELVGTLDDDEAAAVAQDVNHFGFALQTALLEAEDGNVVTSPLSVATLLAMVTAGTQGKTAQELVDALGLESAQDQRFAALLRQVSATDEVKLSVGNAVWLDDDHELTTPYATFVEQVFGARAEVLDLAGPDAVPAIDGWVTEQTEGRITEVAEGLSLPSSDVMAVLANAVYFLGTWTQAFAEDDTVVSGFELADGTSVEVDTMHARDGLEGAQVAYREGYDVLRLPYGEGGRFGMEVFLPARDSDVGALLARLDADERAEALSALVPAGALELAMPRFELAWGESSDIIGALQSLGVRRVFEPHRDQLAPMSPTAEYLGALVHRTYVRVDEQGTEAAAVTAGGIMLTSAPPSFRVDRPFVFTIGDRETGAILFLGTVMDPRG